MTTPAGFPDFFVIGAPRCGTTSFCRFFAKNPQICFSRPKEPHYFARLRDLPSPETLQRDYIERYFGHREARHRAAGEGSVSYLYSPRAIERILHFNPQARFIVMLRNPMVMLPSYHLKLQFMLQEDEGNFAKAWRLQAARARGERLPPHCLDPLVLQYGEVVKYGAHLERVFQAAGRERTHVILFDDFLADALGVYRNVLRFLEVDYDGRQWFSPRNESRTYRFRWLQRLFFLRADRKRGRKAIANRVELKQKRGEARKAGLLQRLAQWNQVPASPTPMTREMRGVVAEHLRADNERLSRLLGRDLSFWLAEAAVPAAPPQARAMREQFPPLGRRQTG
jgi:hypothetical protein